MSTPAPSLDPGLTQQYTGSLKRAINKDGTFNVIRKGDTGVLGSAYQHLVGLTWPRFGWIVALSYLAVNLLFAALYLLLGPDSLHASERDLGMGPYSRAFFFSVHTLTTVGYGALYPFGLAANLLAGLEAALGLMGFALATGLLYARFSRPSAKLTFSQTMIVAPHRDGHSLQFRIANLRRSTLMDVEADLILMTVEQGANGQLQRKFSELKLERRKISFLALTWTLVHPLDDNSPLAGKNGQDLERLQAEVIILIKGFDDAFGQVVHSRYSYRWDEILWSARFAPAFDVAEAGHLVLDIARVGDIVRI